MSTLAQKMIMFSAKTFCCLENAREGAYWQMNPAAAIELLADLNYHLYADPQKCLEDQPFADIPVRIVPDGQNEPTVALIYNRCPSWNITIGSAEDPAPWPADAEVVKVQMA